MIRIIHEFTSEALQDRINKSLSQGWKLDGPIIVTFNAQGNPHSWIQGMLKQ